MSKFHVMCAIASGAIFDTGRRVAVTVMARDRLDAALRAEQSVDEDLSDVEYSHAQTVQLIGKPAAIALSMAA